MKGFIFVLAVIFIPGIMAQTKQFETITLGSGCFWCSEAIYERVNGVVDVTPGYSGGHVKNPTYEEVCTGNTGHAEVVRITINPEIVSVTQILEVYFKTHDPTQLNRQGNDIGTQYRSVIFYHNENQKNIAEKIIGKLTEEKIWNDPVVTQIVPFNIFYKAEDYHENYYENNPNQSYCRFVITPKIEKFEKLFDDMLKQ